MDPQMDMNHQHMDPHLQQPQMGQHPQLGPGGPCDPNIGPCDEAPGGMCRPPNNM